MTDDPLPPSAAPSASPFDPPSDPPPSDSEPAPPGAELSEAGQAAALQFGPAIPVAHLRENSDNLYCPQCEYSLRHLVEMGMNQCPECGCPLNFEQLRLWRGTGQDLGSHGELFWNLVLRPGRFLRGLAAPPYYVQIQNERYFFSKAWLGGAILTGIGTMLLFGIIAGLSGVGSASGPAVGNALFCGGVFAAVGWDIKLAVAHFAGRFWIKHLLKWAGHTQPHIGARRIMFFASPVLLAMVATTVVNLVTSALSFALMNGDLPANRAMVPVYLALAFSYGLWFYWAYVVMQGFKAETRSQNTMLAPLAFFNLGLVLLAIPAGLALLFGLSHMFRLW